MDQFKGFRVKKSYLNGEQSTTKNISDQDFYLLDGIILSTNCLEYDLINQSQLPVFKYRVIFHPHMPSVRFRKLIIQQFHLILSSIRIFDSKENSLYLPYDLKNLFNNKNEPLKLIGKIPYSENNSSEVEVELYQVTTDVKDDFTEVFLTLIMNRAMELLGFIEISDGFYSPDEIVYLHEFKLEVYRGVRFAVRDMDTGPKFWFESSEIVRRRSKLIDILKEFQKDENENFKEKFEKNVGGSFIVSELRSPPYFIVNEVRWDLSPLSEFEYFGKHISFKDFFLQLYGIQLTDLNQPLLISKKTIRPKKSHNEESKTHSIENYHPFFSSKSVGVDNNPSDILEISLVHLPEFSSLSGIITESRINHSMKKQIEKCISWTPAKKIDRINSVLTLIKDAKIYTDYFSNWGIQINTQLLDIGSKVLKGPILSFSPSSNSSKLLLLTPSKAQLNLELDFSSKETFLDSHLKFMSLSSCAGSFFPIPVLNWALISSNSDSERVKDFRAKFTESLDQIGLKFFSNSQILFAEEFGNKGEKLSLVEKFNKGIESCKKVQFIIIIVPNCKESQIIYESCKRKCLLEIGIPTQFIRSKTLGLGVRLNGICRKVASQINCKLGGAPWALISKNTHIEDIDGAMIVGFDVYHDRDKKNKSVLAIIFTLNTEATKFYTRTIFQTPGQETCDSLLMIFVDATVEYFRENGSWPKQLIVFRDGVSNFYFDLILFHEVEQIRKSFEFYPTQIAPTLLFIVVQKYTTDRFFLLHGNDVSNPVVGTVVDNVITRTKFLDFFLMSQLLRGGGSGQPTRCVILYNDTGKDLPWIQSVTYASSFSYFNWPGSIRIPAVCQYAHKAAFLVGKVLKSEPLPCFEKQLYYL